MRSIAFGQNTTASGANSQAFGANNGATGNQSFAGGNRNKVTGNNAASFGRDNQVLTANAFALGSFNSIASGAFGSLVLGTSNAAQGAYSLVVGESCLAQGTQSFAGGGISATGNAAGASIAYGEGAIANGSVSFAFGSAVTSNGNYSFVTGSNSQSNGTSSLALGVNNQSNGNNSVTIGSGMQASAPGSFAMGSAFGVLNNTIAQSLMIGFNSNVSTLFVGPATSAPTGNVGIGELAGMGGQPNNKLEINSNAAGDVPGSSGLRFTDLTTNSTPATNPGTGVLAVDGNGDVIYVKDAGTANVTADNGLMIDPVNSGNGSLKVYAADLSSGVYTYSIIADGKLIDTKKMVKTD